MDDSLPESRDVEHISDLSTPLILKIPHFDQPPNENIQLEELSSIYDADIPAALLDDTAVSKPSSAFYTPEFDEDDVSVRKSIDQGWVVERKIYDVLPKIVKSGGEWPMHTNVHCWWCCFPFETRPVPIARYHVDDTFKVEGVFCSFSCAKTYIHKNTNVHSVLPTSNYMFKKMTNTRTGELSIPCAPPREMLKIFGGPYSIEEFRNSSTQWREYSTLPFNCISMNQHIEEMMRTKIQLATNEVVEVNHVKLPKRKRQSKDEGIMINGDSELMQKMQEAKEKLGSIPISKTKKPRKSSKENENQSIGENSQSSIQKQMKNDPVRGASEFTVDKMMGLKIVRREKSSSV